MISLFINVRYNSNKKKKELIKFIVSCETIKYALDSKNYFNES